MPTCRHPCSLHSTVIYIYQGCIYKIRQKEGGGGGGGGWSIQCYQSKWGKQLQTFKGGGEGSNLS